MPAKIGFVTPERAQLAKTPQTRPTNWEVVHDVLRKPMMRLVKPLVRKTMRAPRRVTGIASDGSRGMTSLRAD